VTAGKNEAQPVVFYVFSAKSGGSVIPLPNCSAMLPAMRRIWRPGGGDRWREIVRPKPARFGVRGDSFLRPSLHRCGESVVQRFLRQVEVTQQADQRCEHAARVGAIDRVDPLPHGCDLVILQSAHP